MSIEITPNYYYEDFNYDSCGNEAMAVLSINNTKIPLCSDCINELTEKLKKFNETIFCYKCEEFVMSNSGWRYGGSCKRQQRLKSNIEITEENAGYISCVECMDTCEHAIIKKETNE